MRPIELRTDVLPLYATGAFADVFDLGDGRVLKAFRSAAPAFKRGADPSLVPEIGFRAELEAYERLQEFPELAAYTPRFHGAADPESYPLASGASYGPGCGLILEKVPGTPVKLYLLPLEAQRRVERVVEEIRGVVPLDDPYDGSCFMPGTRAAFTLIDLATPTERYYALDQMLARHGHVPRELRGQLGLPSG